MQYAILILMIFSKLLFSIEVFEEAADNLSQRHCVCFLLCQESRSASNIWVYAAVYVNWRPQYLRKTPNQMEIDNYQTITYLRTITFSGSYRG
jgi:hypothetical protein